MEPSNYYHHHHHHLSSYFATATAAPSEKNGLMGPKNGGPDGGPTASQTVYPHSIGPSSAAVTAAPVDPGRRKRGRPRKYGTPEQALAAKKSAAAASSSVSKERREADSGLSPLYFGSSKKLQQLAALGFGYAGQGFTPHVITVAAGEDVGLKLMSFLQQSKREMCILSASGSVSNACLRQRSTSGGNITYEGRFEIISMSGSYIRTETGGRSGGLSVSLSNTDWQIIGGVVAGPLKAGGPVQVVVGTFLLDSKKDASVSVKGDLSASKFLSPAGGQSISGSAFRSSADSSERNPIGGNDVRQTMHVDPFLAPHNQTMHLTTTRAADWRDGLDTRSSVGYDLTGTGHGTHHSPANGNYGQFD